MIGRLQSLRGQSSPECPSFSKCADCFRGSDATLLPNAIDFPGADVNTVFRIIRLFSRRPAGLYRAIRWLARNPKHRRRILVGGLSVIAAGSLVAELTLDDRHLPWHPLAIDERAGFSTDLKLAAIKLGPAAWCERLLSGSVTLQSTSLAPHDGAQGCGW